MNNIIHRAGYGVNPEEGKPQTSSAMRPQLAILTWIWSRQDAALGISHLIHKPDGQPYRCKLSGTVREVMADAGIPEVCVHHLRHAAISHMMQDGYCVGTVSDVIGVSPKTVWRVYRQWGMHAQQLAIGAGRLPVVKRWTAQRADPVADADNGTANQGTGVSFRRKVAPLQRPTNGRAVRKPTIHRAARKPKAVRTARGPASHRRAR